MNLLASATEGVADVNYGTADLLFLVAFIALVIVGVISIVQRAALTGIAWIAIGLIPLALMFITP